MGERGVENKSEKVGRVEGKEVEERRTVRKGLSPEQQQFRQFPLGLASTLIVLVTATTEW